MVRDIPQSQDAFTNQIWIPTSYNVGDMLHTHACARVHVRTHACQSHQGHSDQKKVCDTPQSQDACTNQIWIPTSNSVGDMLRTHTNEVNSQGHSDR